MLNFKPQPPAEAFAFWQKKVPVTRKEFDALADDAKALAFIVSGLHRLDQVSIVHRQLEKALVAGQPFAAFKKEITSRLDKKLHSRHLETIYRTNMQTAYQVGRYAQMKETAQTMPWWRYVAVGDKRTRKEHLALNGLVRRHDDPFWDSFYPPNGFRCRCTVQALSERTVAKKGYTTGEGTPQRIVWKDPNTGMEYPITPIPDKGFANNPAIDVWQPDFGKYRADLKQAALAALGAACRKEKCYPQLTRRLTQQDLEDMETALWARNLRHDEDFAQWVARSLKTMQPKGELFPVGNLPAKVLRAMPVQPRMALVTIDDRQLIHMARDHKKNRGATLTLKELQSLPNRLENARWYRDTTRENYFFAWVRMDEKWLKVVVEPDYKIAGKKTLVANHIVTSGVVKKKNIEGHKGIEEI